MSGDERQAALEQRFNAMSFGAGGAGADAAADSTTSYYQPQSASARFERFFNTGPPSSEQTPTGYGHLPLPPSSAMGYHPPPQQQQQHQYQQQQLQAQQQQYYGNATGAPSSSIPAGYNAFGGSGIIPSNMGSFGSGRPRQAARNGAYQWDSSLSPHVGGNAALSSPLSPHATLVTPPPGSTQTGPQGYYGAPLDSGAYAAHGQPSFADEDVIPTAIVVKNIPFSVKKEQLLQIIEELRIPMPYAFNYHFDQGIFRGLAFANFRSSEEADAVVAALNGFDVAGRKLRVEYKKVLQVGEKERIEKEKALKRMRSMQMEKDRVRRETDPSAVPPLPSPSTALPPGSALGVDTYGAGSTSGGDPYGNGLQQQPDRLSPPISRSPGPADRASPTSASDAPPSSSGKREELDLNDPQALEIYSRVLLFKDDRMRDELAFSRNLSPQERRTVHLVAQKLNLYHYSVGEAEERHVIVTKNEVRSPSAGSRPLRSQASTIGRSQRAGDQAAAAAAAAAGGGIGGSGAGTFASINRRSSGMLRGKKSAPDIKRNRGEMQYDISTMPSGGYGSAAHFSTANGLTQSLGRKSNGNLREGYGSTSAMGSSAKGRTAGGGGGIGGAAGLQSLFASPFEVPPVPSLGTSYGPESTGYSTSVGGNGGSTISAGANGALRQPRGPPTPGQSTESRNFAPRINRMAANAAAAAGSSSQGSTEGSSDKVGSSDVRPQYGADMEGRLASIDVQSREPLE